MYGNDLLLDAGLLDQASGQGPVFPLRNHPADHVTAEDVEDDVEVVVDPSGRTTELGDVPRPDLVRGSLSI